MRKISALILLSGIVLAQDPAEMEAWTKHMTAGENHTFLAKMVGEWTTESKSWMAPGQEPMMSQGEATYKMTMGGRYQVSHFKGNMMGMPFEGMGITAYDNTLKQFTATWIDTFGTSITIGSGKRDGNTIHIKGTMPDPMSGGKLDYRYIFTMENDDKAKMVMYSGSGDEEFVSMEMVYTRKKSSS